MTGDGDYHHPSAPRVVAHNAVSSLDYHVMQPDACIFLLAPPWTQSGVVHHQNNSMYTRPHADKQAGMVTAGWPPLCLKKSGRAASLSRDAAAAQRTRPARSPFPFTLSVVVPCQLLYTTPNVA